MSLLIFSISIEKRSLYLRLLCPLLSEMSYISFPDEHTFPFQSFDILTFASGLGPCHGDRFLQPDFLRNILEN